MRPRGHWGQTSWDRAWGLEAGPGESLGRKKSRSRAVEDRQVQVVSARPGHTLPQAWGRGLGLDLHRGHLRQCPDPAARRQGFAISLQQCNGAIMASTSQGCGERSAHLKCLEQEVCVKQQLVRGTR